MKERILKGWNFMRVFYLGVGLFILVQGILQQQWLGALVGGYFASMGLFAFGCASGSCFGGSCEYTPPANKHSDKTLVITETVEKEKQ